MAIRLKFLAKAYLTPALFQFLGKAYNALARFVPYHHLAKPSEEVARIVGPRRCLRVILHAE